MTTNHRPFRLVILCGIEPRLLARFVARLHQELPGVQVDGILYDLPRSRTTSERVVNLIRRLGDASYLGPPARMFARVPSRGLGRLGGIDLRLAHAYPGGGREAAFGLDELVAFCEARVCAVRVIADPPSPESFQFVREIDPGVGIVYSTRLSWVPGPTSRCASGTRSGSSPYPGDTREICPPRPWRWRSARHMAEDIPGDQWLQPPGDRHDRRGIGSSGGGCPTSAGYPRRWAPTRSPSFGSSRGSAAGTRTWTIRDPPPCEAPARPRPRHDRRTSRANDEPPIGRTGVPMTSLRLPAIALALALAGAGLGLAARLARRRGLDRWLLPYLLDAPRRRPRRPGEAVHLLLAIADHFEPKWGGAPADVARGASTAGSATIRASSAASG
ncbi:MAG: hypothetical protein WKF75_01755 [Singulisphaera sp.]